MRPWQSSETDLFRRGPGDQGVGRTNLYVDLSPSLGHRAAHLSSDKGRGPGAGSSPDCLTPGGRLCAQSPGVGAAESERPWLGRLWLVARGAGSLFVPGVSWCF